MKEVEKTSRLLYAIEKDRGKVFKAKNELLTSLNIVMTESTELFVKKKNLEGEKKTLS